MMTRPIGIFLPALALLCACSNSDPSPVVVTDYDCNESDCNVQIMVQNAGTGTFDLNYHFDAHSRGFDDSVGELNGEYVIASGESTTLSKRFPVTSKPNTVSTAVEVVRR